MFQSIAFLPISETGSPTPGPANVPHSIALVSAEG
jgi:hypothetical protein